jgi:murein DD-endopeptidase MepM/ murein hydrolase activator NlpD
MKRFLFILNFIAPFALYSQNSVIEKYTLEVESPVDYWELELAPLTDLNEIVSYIHNDSYSENLVKYVPAGYPLRKEVDVNSFYGARFHPIHASIKFHRGIDLKSITGDIVQSTGDGFVLETGEKSDLGKYIKIKHKYGFESIYGHLSAINVKSGQKIVKNQLIGRVGATGAVTGPHLHYTLKKNGNYLDPFDFLFMNFGRNE